MHRIYGDRVDFVGVAGRDDLSAMNEFIDTFDVGAFEHAVDSDGSVWRDFEISTQPSFVFMDADGETTTHVGALGVDGLSERLDDLTS